MANNKSAIKRIRQTEKRRIRNRLVVGAMRSAIRRARVAVDTKEETAPALIVAAGRLVDRAVSRGAIKRTTGSRYISRLGTRIAPEAVAE